MITSKTSPQLKTPSHRCRCDLYQPRETTLIKTCRSSPFGAKLRELLFWTRVARKARIQCLLRIKLRKNLRPMQQKNAWNQKRRRRERMRRVGRFLRKERKWVRRRTSKPRLSLRLFTISTRWQLLLIALWCSRIETSSQHGIQTALLENLTNHNQNYRHETH